MNQNENSTESAGNSTNATTMENRKRSCEILLNNFQIKKKRYRVLLNFDHIVWERWDPKGKVNNKNEKEITNKETEFEKEQLSNRTQYNSDSHVVYITEIIRVRKGNTKSMTLRVESQPSTNLNNISNINADDSINFVPNSQLSNNSQSTAQYLTIHYAERIIKSPTDCNRWRIRTLTLYNADPYIVTQWHTLLSKKLYENPARLHIRRLLVFINPYGGRKEGLQTYERHCKSIFQLAGIDASCVISQRANQIRDIIMSHDFLTSYDAVCCVGGDGTAAEVINGLIFRAMRDRGLDMRRPAYIPKPALPIGIIPAGSTDTVAYSVHGSSDPTTAAIHVILGQRRGCDICSVRNRQGIVRFCASVFSYGYLGDVAARSEKYRWMGPKRYEYTGVKAFLANRGYEAEIRILENQEDDNEVEACTSRTTLALESVCYANCQRCSSVISKHNGEGDENSLQSKYNAPENEAGVNNIASDMHEQQHMGNEVLQTTNSNWTLCTEKSFEHDNNNEKEDMKGAAGDASDVVDKTLYKIDDIIPERNDGDDSNISKDMTNCDRNLQEDLSEKRAQIKILTKCDNQETEKKNESGNENENDKQTTRDTETIASQNSFSFCSTSSTNNFNKLSNSNSNNEVAMTPTSMTSPQWKIIRGHFFMISCANITCACSRTPNGISPYNHLGDGQLDLILVRKTSILNNLRFALNTMGRNGDIRNLPFVEVYRTRQLHFRAKFPSAENDETMRASTQPIATDFSDEVSDNLVSSWNCDGEVVHDLDITMTSHCQLIDVFMRGPYSYTTPVTEGATSCLFCCCNSSSN